MPDIAHPNRPEIIVTARKPRVADEFALRDEKDRARVPIAVVHPDTREVIRDQNGDVEVAWRSRFGLMDEATARTRRLATGWQNVTDPDGKPLPFSAANIPILWEPHLNATLDACLICGEKSHPDDASHEFVNVIPFGAFVNRALSE